MSDARYWLMTCRHRTDADAADVREQHRDAHRRHVATGGGGVAKVLIGSALLTADGKPIGNFGVLEAASLDKARAFAEEDPFSRAGLVTSIEITALPQTFQAHRIDPMTQS